MLCAEKSGAESRVRATYELLLAKTEYEHPVDLLRINPLQCRPEFVETRAPTSKVNTTAGETLPESVC